MDEEEWGTSQIKGTGEIRAQSVEKGWSGRGRRIQHVRFFSSSKLKQKKHRWWILAQVFLFRKGEIENGKLLPHW